MIQIDSAYYNRLQDTITCSFVHMHASSMLRSKNDHLGQAKHDFDRYQYEQQYTKYRHYTDSYICQITQSSHRYVDNQALFSRNRTGSFHQYDKICWFSQYNTQDHTHRKLHTLRRDHKLFILVMTSNDVFLEPTVERKYDEKVEISNRKEICVAQ